MPVLGHGGSLELRREAPNPIVLTPNVIDPNTNSILVRDPAYWTGDFIRLTCANGLPLHANVTNPPIEGTAPDAPNGYAMYVGSKWYLGYNKAHVETDNDTYYTLDTSSFYATPAETDFTSATTLYIYRDQLDRVSFYTNKAYALLGSTTNRVALYTVDINAFIMSPVGNTTYHTTIDSSAVTLQSASLSRDETALHALLPSTISTLKDADTIVASEWKIQAYLNNWVLNLSAPEVDTTALGERFGDSIKSLVTGGGTLDFLIDRTSPSENNQDTTILLHLLLMTQKGCKATARFYMFKNRLQASYILPGSLYYELDVMITSEAINTRSDELIAGSLDFVTVGNIALKMGTN